MYRGAEIIIKTLIDNDVEVVFGYPGGAVLDIYDALYDYRDLIKHIMPCHEQGGAHAADGYSRSSGKTGVVIATSGPGSTNIVTAIATAYMDSVPMVVITGNVPSSLLGKDSFQETDIVGITMPITKHNFRVRNVKDLQKTIHRAFEIANDKRKGPVLIDIPKDLMQDMCEYDEVMREHKRAVKPISEDDIKHLAKLINEAKKPLIYCGGGVAASGSFEEVRTIIDKGDVPACHTLMGIGVLGYEDELNLGLVGMHGNVSSNYAIEECDLLVALGVRFSDRVALNTKKFAPNATIVHLEIDESEISKNVFVNFSMVCNVKDALSRVIPYIKEQKRPEWVRRVQELKQLDFRPEDDEKVIKPHQVIKYISEKFGEELIFATDVGQHQMWAAQYCGRTKPRSFLTSGGLGTMGFGFGAAIGGKLANPDRPVVLITGDASFHMNMNECTTAAHYGLNIITVVMNNNALGLPRQWQHYIYKDRYSETDFYRNTDFVKLAEAFGVYGYSCKTFDEFCKAFDASIHSDRPVIIEVFIDHDENVLPMIPAGGTVRDLILE